MGSRRRKCFLSKRLKNAKAVPSGWRKRIQKYVDSVDWVFSKTMPQWPHWYILPKKNDKEFDFLMGVIEKCGKVDPWGKKKWAYSAIGKFKYWGFDLPRPLMNRASPLTNDEVRRKGAQYMKKHDLVFGPYGRAIKKTRR